MGKPKGDESIMIPATPPQPPNVDATDEDNRTTVVELVVLGGSHCTLIAVTDDRLHGILYDMKWIDENKRDRGRLHVNARRTYTAPTGPGTGAFGSKEFELYFPLVYPVPLRKTMTVAELTHFITSRHMDNFVFNDFNMGCRYWVLTLVSELERKEIVKKGTRGALEIEAVDKLFGETHIGLFPDFEQV